MTNEEAILLDLKELKRELADVKTDLHTITLCVTGDKIKDVPGIMDFLQTHKNELYGNMATQHVGLKARMDEFQRRLEKLEDDRKKLYWMSAGITGSVIGVWAVLKALMTGKIIP